MNLTFKPLPDLSSDNLQITVEARKYDDSIHRRWPARLLEETLDLWILIGVFETEIKHPNLGVIRPGTISLEYYWKKLCYNVFRFHEPTGELRNFYCNVNLPPILQNNVLSYVDLDIDVIVEPDFSYQVIDLDEFAENSDRHQYPLQIIETAETALDALIKLIEKRDFPFNFKI